VGVTVNVRCDPKNEKRVLMDDINTLLRARIIP
jgi:hypothetical protein